MDAVACAVSSEVFDSGVTHLDKETIADIYSGKITNWSQLGGLDRDILVIDKEHHRGTRHVFMGYVMGDKNAKASGADLVTGSNNELQSKIIASDSAIGMLSMAWLNDDVKGMSIKVDGGLIESTVENVRNGSYPIARELNLVTVGEPKGVLKDFIDFIKSEEGRKITEESGYVPVI